MHPLLQYHLETSHERTKLTGRSLNWGDQPIPFKLYRDVPVVHLPQEFTLPEVDLDKAMRQRPMTGDGLTRAIAGICNLASGITQVKKQDEGKVFHFRGVPSAGALYPTELYLAVQNAREINDGLYHYCPLRHILSLVKPGQVFSALGGTDPVVRFYLTSIFHRSAWKYGPRAFRYCLLDAGHMAQNLLLAARIHGFPARVDYDFDDDAINDFLCIDAQLEGCVAQVHALGCSHDTPIYDTVAPGTCDLQSFSRSAAKADAPEGLLAAYRQSSGPGQLPPSRPGAPEGATPIPKPIMPSSTVSVVQRRRSRRNFITAPASTRDLVDILAMLCPGSDGKPAYANAVDVAFLAGGHSGLQAGLHRMDRVNRTTRLVRGGELMQRSARVCLDQGWLENAALHIVFTADIAALERELGPRAYRYAHLEAGRLGHLAYLGATAKNLGACGIGAFFDKEAATLLELPEGHALLYLVAVGPVRG